MSVLGNKGNVVETPMLLVKVTLGISALSFHTSANLHLTNFYLYYHNLNLNKHRAYQGL